MSDKQFLKIFLLLWTVCLSVALDDIVFYQPEQIHLSLGGKICK